MAKLKINFSHVYSKLLHNGEPIKEAKLLLVIPAQMEELTARRDFLNYDTDGKYELTFAAWYVMLFFQKPSGDLFTTVRPMHGRYGNKHQYYKQFEGQMFDIVFSQEVRRG
jgi:hypothetical protein